MNQPTATWAADRQKLADESKSHGLLEYWVERKALEEPRQKAVPFCWRWAAIHPLLQAAAKIVPVEEAHRRALLLANPGLHPRPFMTSTLYGGCSLYNPGEVASVHRHMPSASRFVLAGDGGFTTVEGEKCTMSRGDLIITPNGAWHDHGNDGKEPVIWVDLLDLPLAEALNSSYFDFEYAENAGQSNSGEPVRRGVQTVTCPPDYSVRLYSSGGLLPRFVTHRRGKGHGSPKFVYRWQETLQALRQLRDIEGDPRDGIILEYVNPVDGRSVLPTLSFHAQLFRPGQATQWQRQTASTAFCVVQGRGRTELDESSLDWRENDIFIVPSWYWYRHANPDPDQDVILFSVSDRPALEKLEYLRSQVRTEDGRILEIGNDEGRQ